LFATLVGGLAAGVLATILSGAIVWCVFLTPHVAPTVLTNSQALSLALFACSATVIIWGAEQYRLLVTRLDEEEHYRKVVVDELGHRVKNKLATVYAILRHELRGQGPILESISGRLRALSAADDFLTESTDGGTELHAIVKMELEPYDASRVSLQGEPIEVPSKLATILALMIHELATNAAKYGALSMSCGRVCVSWSMVGGQVVIEWREVGGPLVGAPTRRGFGRKIIERGLDPFGGEVETKFEPTGVTCRVSFPLAARESRRVFLVHDAGALLSPDRARRGDIPASSTKAARKFG
jgi:two-component sensor histidine kinase